MAYAATIGFFDGVHRGHRHVISRLQALARSRGLQSMVITFSNHPMEVVRPGSAPELLLPFEEKMESLRATGVDKVVAYPFDRTMMSRPAREFMEHLLRDELDVRLLMIGYDNRFGRRDASETFGTYVRYGRELGIEVVEGPRPEASGLFEGRPVSSSLLRELIRTGREDAARELMGL
ncbi:MAG: FAD synthetase family protein [Bacteroidales bacterium]|nr:FAD synthetase family protein [Bacteroidales bacterium]MCM1146832.1 FAD synthetase family protein [Bacteroidales bacterium]MCM1205670.1 FAD synthetase family protein [Bacillota bacterium]MCM1510218.1 FAD synthetase family protein [Clostridium sp.]